MAMRRTGKPVGMHAKRVTGFKSLNHAFFLRTENNRTDENQEELYKIADFLKIVCAHSNFVVPLHRQKKHSKDCLG